MNLSLLIAAHFMSGQALFSGMALTTLAAFLRLRATDRRGRSITTILIALSVVCVLASATPWPFWLYGLWLLLVIAAMWPQQRHAALLRYGSAALLAFSCAGLAAYEAPYHRSPAIPLSDTAAIYVLGDSLSMGAEPDGQNWHAIVGDAVNIPVTSLAFGGATTRTILHNATRIQETPALVFLEIGGNDLLAGNPAFDEDLERLVAAVCAPGRRAVLFELPLPPGHNRYGRAQRRIARKYDVILIPKKHLAAALSIPEATTDGLHLSVYGHQLLADQVLRLLCCMDCV